MRRRLATPGMRSLGRRRQGPPKRTRDRHQAWPQVLLAAGGPGQETQPAGRLGDARDGSEFSGGRALATRGGASRAAGGKRQVKLELNIPNMG